MVVLRGAQITVRDLAPVRTFEDRLAKLGRQPAAPTLSVLTNHQRHPRSVETRPRPTRGGARQGTVTPQAGW
jgi:hypothetical protein